MEIKHKCGLNDHELKYMLPRVMKELEPCIEYDNGLTIDQLRTNLWGVRVGSRYDVRFYRLQDSKIRKFIRCIRCNDIANDYCLVSLKKGPKFRYYYTKCEDQIEEWIERKESNAKKRFVDVGVAKRKKIRIKTKSQKKINFKKSA